MAKAISKLPEVANYFLEIVKAFGGMENVSWTKVARQLHSAHQFKVDRPQQLKQVYEHLTKEWTDLNQKEVGIMISCYIVQRGDNKTSYKKFQELTGKGMAHDRFILQAKQQLVKAFKQILQMFCRKKKFNFIDYKMTLVQSLLVMIGACDLKNQTDPIINNVHRYALKFEEVVLQYSKIIYLDKPKIFEELQPIFKRQDAAWITYYVQLIFELRQIFLRNYDRDDQLLGHPLLEKTIELNKKLPIYKLLIDKSDWIDKYQMYNTIELQDVNQYKMSFNQIFPDQQSTVQQIDQKLQIKQVGAKKSQTNSQFKMVRGKLMKDGDLVQRGWKTVIFENEEDDENQVVESTVNKRKKMQALYEEAFGHNN